MVPGELSPLRRLGVLGEVRLEPLFAIPQYSRLSPFRHNGDSCYVWLFVRRSVSICLLATLFVGEVGFASALEKVVLRVLAEAPPEALFIF